MAYFTRFYRAEDEAAAIELWHRAWQEAYPEIDFTSRLEWWRERWRKDLVELTELGHVRLEADRGFQSLGDNQPPRRR